MEAFLAATSPATRSQVRYTASPPDEPPVKIMSAAAPCTSTDVSENKLRLQYHIATYTVEKMHATMTVPKPNTIAECTIMISDLLPY